MSTATITEALAELKTIEKRVAKKQEAIRGLLVRQDGLKDPLEKQGGSVNFVATERQSICDLEERGVRIRLAIGAKNADTNLTVNGQTRSVADWLVWRREVSGNRQKFLCEIRERILAARGKAQRDGIAVVKSASEATQLTDLIVNVDELLLTEQIEGLEEILGTLDGKLSLLNATTSVTVAD
jgi:hypothetical protein